METVILSAIASVTDLKTNEIPHHIIIGGLIALFYGWIMGFLGNIWLGLILGFIMGTVLYAIGLWAGGDVKLLAVIGGFKGWDIIPYTIVLLSLVIIYYGVLKVINPEWNTAPMAHLFLCSELLMLII